MSGDYSRHRFNPRNDYAGVRMQQGRVQLDADWNEWTDLIDRRQRAETVDTFGVKPTPGISGVAVVSPQTPDAFKIEASGGTYTIGCGRMYVDGLLAENHGSDPQAFDPVLAESYGQNPLAYNQQPYHPVIPTLPSGGPHLAYLEVWQREVTHLQRPDLVEKAVGVDTTTRSQTVWQVRLLENVGSADCTSPDSALPVAWQAMISPSAGRLSSRAVGVPPDEDPCELPPSGGYRGLENQLYRIEIHDSGGIGEATFKWSRDNASVCAAVVEVVSSTELKLASLGRDAVLRFNTDDWVEIIDDWRELSGEGGDPALRQGEIRKITVNETNKSISFSPALPAEMIPSGAGDDTLEKRHLRICRWDHKGIVRDDADNVIVDLDAASSQGVIPVPASGTWVTLEKGVQVEFSQDPAGGDFKTGDHWTFAARTADASVEELDQAPPLGIHRHYARLALVTFPNDEEDCREHWPPDCGGGCCTIVVAVGDSIQEALNALPTEGGCVCLKTGVHEITSPLEIHSSNVKFHGESPGAIVRATTDLPYLLEVGSSNLSVSDVEVLGIRFEATVPAEAAFLLYLNHCAEVRVAQCELEMMEQKPSAHIGIWMQDVRDVVVTGNRLHNLLNGIRVNDYRGRLMIENNIIEGIELRYGNIHSSFGENGIRIDNEFVAPCHIEHNRIDHFWFAIRLREGASYSHVANNRITRSGEQIGEPMPTNVDELRQYLDGRYYAIDIEADHCRVEGNYINLPASLWSGIRTTAQHTLIADNILRSSSKFDPLSPVPASIYCVGSADLGEAADHSQVINNRLVGPQVGVVISRVNAVAVEKNVVEGEGAGWFGVRVDDCNECCVGDNRLEDVTFGIYLSAGESNTVCGNQVSQCGMGISSLTENLLNVSNNSVDACLLTGIVLAVMDSAAVTENRVSNCGYVGNASLGIAVFAEHFFVESEALVRIEGCEVLDTGINPQTNVGNDTPVFAISALCPVCHVTHNRTGYTQNVLNPEREHRALILVGPLALHYVFNDLTVEFMFGSAVVTDNHFRGPGRSYLVEFFPVRISDNLDLRFEKVTFNNNICDHLNAEAMEDAATVRLWGRNLIAMSNHIKAPNGVNAMSLGNRHRVALMGNITTGGYIRVGTVTPAPLTDFNIRT